MAVLRNKRPGMVGKRITQQKLVSSWHFKLFDNQRVVVLLMKKSHDFFIFPLLSRHVAVIQIVFLQKHQVIDFKSR